MDIRVAIKVADEKDHRHLSTTLRLANLRDESVRWIECPQEEADVVILRRGEPDSIPLLSGPRAGSRPVLVIYSMNPNERHPWVLRWPARTTDLSALAETLVLMLKAQATRTGEHRQVAGSPTQTVKRA